MTETTDTTQEPQEPAQEPLESTEAPEPTELDAQGAENEDDEKTEPNRGEAKLRKRAQTAEAERDDARGQLDALRRSVIEDKITTAGYKPRAVLATLYDDISALFDENGAVDSEKLDTAMRSAADELGLEKPRRLPKPNAAQGAQSGQPPAPAPTFADAFKRKPK